MWQPAILAFLGRSQLSYDTLRGFVHNSRNKSTVVQWIKHYIDLDFALPMFVLAQHFAV